VSPFAGKWNCSRCWRLQLMDGAQGLNPFIPMARAHPALAEPPETMETSMTSGRWWKLTRIWGPVVCCVRSLRALAELAAVLRPFLCNKPAGKWWYPLAFSPASAPAAAGAGPHPSNLAIGRGPEPLLDLSPRSGWGSDPETPGKIKPPSKKRKKNSTCLERVLDRFWEETGRFPENSVALERSQAAALHAGWRNQA